MATTTITLKAFLGTSGLTGTAGLAIYAANGTTVVAARSTAGIIEIGTSKTYQKAGVVVDYDTEYTAICDRAVGDTLPGQIIYIASGVNVVTANGQPVQNGSGTAAAVAAGSITLAATDPAKSANLTGWGVEILSATTGAGQMRMINSTTTAALKPISANWSPTPTGTIVYMLHAPVPSTATVDPAVIADATVTALFAKPGMLGDGSKTVQQTATKSVARLIGKMDNAVNPGSAVFDKADGSGPAYTQPYTEEVREDHNPSGGL